MNVVDGYELSWHVCINRGYAFPSIIKLILDPLTISSHKWFIGCAEGTYGMLSNGKRDVKVPRYRRAVTISVLPYIETAF